MPVISVMIPAYNAAASIGRTLDSILTNSTPVEIIVVDDCSVDATVSIVSSYAQKHGNITLVRNQTNLGGGGSRNVAIARATGDYYYFIDADDTLKAGALDELVAIMEKTGADVVTFKYAIMVQEGAPLRAMMTQDERAWETIVGAQPLAAVDLDKHGLLLGTVNYPWNKLMRGDFCRSIDLKFSHTAVHNDILAFWMIYLNARSIVMYNSYLITYRQIQGAQQTTNVFDERRLEVFKAFDDVELIFEGNAVLKRRFYQWFLSLKMDVLRWIASRLDASLRPRFCSLMLASYARHMSEQSFYDAHRTLPNVARFSLTMKYAPEKILDFR